MVQTRLAVITVIREQHRFWQGRLEDLAECDQELLAKSRECVARSRTLLANTYPEALARQRLGRIEDARAAVGQTK